MFYLKHKGKKIEIHDDNVSHVVLNAAKNVLSTYKKFYHPATAIYTEPLFSVRVAWKSTRKRSNYKNSVFTHQKLSRLRDGTIPLLMK